MGENKVNENMLEKIEIKKIEKEQFDEYKDEIEKIHNENVFPNNGYLMDEDYIINAEIIFVALLNNKVVGFASINTYDYEPDEGDDLWITIEKNNMQIKQIAIGKEFQGLKIGTHLLNKVKEYAKSKGINNIYLYALGDNEKAHKFYERNGFKLSGIWSAKEYMEIKDFKSYLFAYTNKMKCKAIFLDMDGTLLNSEKEVSDYSIKILKEIKQKGIEIILISGRCNKSIEHIVKNRINNKDEIIRYIISTDGTMIKDLKENKIIYQSKKKKKLVKELIYKSYNFDTAFYIITENDMYKDNRMNEYQKETDRWYINGEFYNIENNLKTIDFNDFSKKNEKVNRILFFSMNLDKLKEINENILKNDEIQTLFRKDFKDYQLLLISNKYSKAIGIIEMCKYLNLSTKDTIAFGDSDNDIEMLEIVGDGIAMKNTKIDLKTNKITEFTNNEDGVAKYLEKMLLEEK